MLLSKKNNLRGILFLGVLAVIAGCGSGDRGKVSDETFKKWTEARAMCLNYPFETHEVEKDFSRQLRSLGLKVTMKKSVTGLDATVEPQKTQVQIYDGRLQKIILQQGESFSFFARIESTPQVMFDIMQRRQLTKYTPLEPVNDDRILYAFLTSRPTQAMPYGQEETMIVIRKTELPNVIEVGCQAMADKNI